MPWLDQRRPLVSADCPDLRNGRQAAATRKKLHLLCIGFSLELPKEGLLRLWSPEDLQILTRARQRCVEDAVRDVVLVGVSDDNLYRLVFKALRPVN